MTDIVAGMRVFPERMRRNLDMTQGLVFSGQLLLDLVEAGAPRDEAYQWVQAHAMAAWESESSFQQRVAADPRMGKYLNPAAIARAFDLDRQLHAVDAIFRRTLGAQS
jgi:adenylosuccinate lyase